MSHNSVLSKDNLDIVFQTFSNTIKQINNNKKVSLYIVGGGAIVASFEYRLSTMDIDAMFATDDEIIKAIKMTAQELQLPNDWLNQDFINTPSFSPKLSEVSTLLKSYNDNLTIYTLPSKYLIAMKLKSSRPTGGDIDDIINMIYELRYKGVEIMYEDIIAAYKTLYDDFSNTYNFYLKKTKEAFDAPLEDVVEIIQQRIFINKSHH
ncbi:MAG: hypothetical protein J5666_06865 [Bacilli bacterium]|nr:hypothetical protein [Bacilli bacterium]